MPPRSPTTSPRRTLTALRPIELRAVRAEPASSGVSALGERLLRLAAASALLLVVAHVLTTFVKRTRNFLPADLLPIFDMSQESSLNSWLTVSLLLLLGLAVCTLAHLRRERSLYGVGAFFLFLSLDDQAMLHERIGTACWSAVRGFGTFPWLIAVAPILVLLGAFVFLQLWRLTSAARALRRRLVLGFACFALALPLEWLESQLAVSGLSWRGVGLAQLTIPIEEALELLAPALLLACVAGMLERALGRQASGATTKWFVVPRSCAQRGSRFKV